jgi:hypothetical protein
MHTSFGERLKFFRINVLKMKRKQFCDTYDLPIITVQSWENSGIKISQTSANKLEEKLRKNGVALNAAWLFEGIGNYWDIFNDEATLKNDATDDNADKTIVYRIDSFFYEPLLKKDAELVLDPVTLKNINCPAFIALRDSSQNMHFGILMVTLNKEYVMEAYQGSFNKITVHDTDEIFLIKKISLYE